MTARSFAARTRLGARFADLCRERPCHRTDRRRIRMALCVPIVSTCGSVNPLAPRFNRPALLVSAICLTTLRCRRCCGDAVPTIFVTSLLVQAISTTAEAAERRQRHLWDPALPLAVVFGAGDMFSCSTNTFSLRSTSSGCTRRESCALCVFLESSPAQQFQGSAVSNRGRNGPRSHSCLCRCSQ